MKYINKLKEKLEALNGDDELVFRTAYEAGCLGYSLYNELTRAGIDCTIMAPSTMMVERGKRQKTDKPDAELIAKCLAYNAYKEVFVLSKEDENTKEFIRMRDAHKQTIKELKQQILSLCLRHGYKYDKTPWTKVHLAYLSKLDMDANLKETLNEYLHT